MSKLPLNKSNLVQISRAFFCQDANDCDGEIRELREHQQALSMELEQKQINCQQLEGTSDTLDGDIDRLLEQKQRVRI